MNRIRPCCYPRCGGRDTDPVLTSLGMCERCQTRLARTLGWVVMDWVHIHIHLPTPARGDRVRRSTQQVFGHPAEWASDTADQIAAVLGWTHDALADHLGDTPPPHPGTAELRRVRAAWNYLECRIPQLALSDFAADVAIELGELHRQIRVRLGMALPRQVLPTPCPACELRTLVRWMDIGRDQIECGNCGHAIDEKHYPFYARVVLDTIIENVA